MCKSEVSSTGVAEYYISLLGSEIGMGMFIYLDAYSTYVIQRAIFVCI